MRSDESRMSRGRRLTGAAWRLMRQDPTMIGLAFLGTGCGLLGSALMLYLGGVFSPHHYSRAVDPGIPYSSMGQVELDVRRPRPALKILPAG